MGKKRLLPSQTAASGSRRQTFPASSTAFTGPATPSVRLPVPASAWREPGMSPSSMGAPSASPARWAEVRCSPCISPWKGRRRTTTRRPPRTVRVGPMTGKHESESPRDQRRVLVVDDDPSLRLAIEWALQDEGLSVMGAGDGQEAIERGTEQRPALVVLDMGLPVVSGDGVAAGLRAAHGTQLPILIITADG